MHVATFSVTGMKYALIPTHFRVRREGLTIYAPHGYTIDEPFKCSAAQQHHKREQRARARNLRACTNQTTTTQYDDEAPLDNYLDHPYRNRQNERCNMVCRYCSDGIQQWYLLGQRLDFYQFSN